MDGLSLILTGFSLPIVALYYGSIFFLLVTFCIIVTFYYWEIAYLVAGSILFLEPIFNGKLSDSLLIGFYGISLYGLLKAISKTKLGSYLEKGKKLLLERGFSTKGLLALWILCDVLVLAPQKIASTQLPYLIFGCLISHVALCYLWRYACSRKNKSTPTSNPNIANSVDHLPPT